MLRFISVCRVTLEESESASHLLLCAVGAAGWHEWYGRIEGVVLVLLAIHFVLRPRRTLREIGRRIDEALQAELEESKKQEN